MSGISSAVPLISSLGLDVPERLMVVEASSLAAAHVPPFPPDAAALITEIDGPESLDRVISLLRGTYPDDHPLDLILAAGTADQRHLKVVLAEAGNAPIAHGSNALYIPGLPKGTSFEALQEVVAHLRAPNGCPWDREQTHLTLRKHLLEETYEALAAIDSGDLDKMREEFGDLLLQVLMNAQIAGEDREFGTADVLRDIHDKLVRRHPHVFGDVRVAGVADVLQNWEKLKADERKSSGDAHKGLLDGIPLQLPGLSQAQEYQARAVRVGFDWPEIEGVLDKIREEIDEVREATDANSVAAELGDLFFALVNLARWKNVDAESALRETNLRFKRRLGHIERGAREMGRALQELSLEEMDALWEQAKRDEN